MGGLSGNSGSSVSSGSPQSDSWRSCSDHEIARSLVVPRDFLTVRYLLVPKEDLMVNFCPALPPPWEALMVSPWEVLSYQKIISWSQSEISHCIKRRSHGKFMSRPTSTTRGSHGLTVRSLVVPRNFLMASPLDKVALRKPASWVPLRWSKSFSVLYWKMLYFMVKDAGIMLADRSQLILKRQPLLDFVVTEIPGQVWCYQTGAN